MLDNKLKKDIEKVLAHPYGKSYLKGVLADLKHTLFTIHFLPNWKNMDTAVDVRWRTACGYDLMDTAGDGDARATSVTCKNCLRSINKKKSKKK